jgi:hypothetical protein
MATTNLTAAQINEQLQATNHFIERGKASAMIKKFTTHKNRLFKTDKKYCTLPFNAPGLPNSITYNKAAISTLLNNTGCVGLRIYPAINIDNRFTLVIVGVDENGENIMEAESEIETGMNLQAQRAVVTGLVDEGQTSPPYPAPASQV